MNVERLLEWYDCNCRSLPWRAKAGKVSDPYKVWVSEIMLQQTTVATVTPYFIKFIRRWPTLEALAGASFDDIQRMWAGLGYYRRARFLHECAKRVLSEHAGRFPEDEKTLRTLPGFGPYTAAAVAAIAFGHKANVVDGNVERVISRVFSIEAPLPKAKAVLRKAAEACLPDERCGDYAQALMDLGALVCMPKAPTCEACPISRCCLSRRKGIQETLPRRLKTKPKPVRHGVAFVLVGQGAEIFVQKRPPRGLLADMLEVPGTPWGEGPAMPFEKALAFAPIKADWRLCPGRVKHVFTHFTLECLVAVVRSKGKRQGRWVSLRDLDDEALPTAMKKIVRHALKQL